MARSMRPERPPLLSGSYRSFAMKVIIVTTGLLAAAAASHSSGLGASGLGASDPQASDSPVQAALQAALPDGAPELRLPRDEEGIPYYLYVPGKVDPEAPPLVAVHGISRGADEHLEAFAPWAERSGRVLIAPLFSEAQCRRYQKVILDRCQADRALFATLREVAEATGVEIDRFDLFGFSGGAQFAHRFALLHPERVARLAVSSAGWYTLPDPAEAYPYGLASGPRAGQRFRPKLEAFLEIPTLVLVGERDIERDSALRKEQRVDQRQGLTRVERAARWSQALRRAATRAGVAAEIRFRSLPNCGHDFEDCVRDGGLVEQVMEWFSRP